MVGCQNFMGEQNTNTHNTFVISDARNDNRCGQMIDKIIHIKSRSGTQLLHIQTDL